ncbi:hypothetical protein [Flavobacterium hercynium]|uniref:Uncharacterized protein n=1 Tax=Flavobacterium hercynium TaxID=387094 RepID=A0A226HK65_9FLAO|nr:hypothetical protein [Flavobacterium hercynium]OXA94729.1 hypothetical protein B0A66_03100 [Flavobacterium hercynium]SMP07626.1 hypothetical protein SAMN06265346_10251 [Flavobacterium hercynium]
MNKSINKLIAIWCCFSLLQCTGQVKHKMEYFNIELYKDWEIDKDHSSSENRKFLKKENERIEIRFSSNKIHVEKSSVINPYLKVQVFRSSTKCLYAEGTEFYQFSIGISKSYDEVGKVTKERDNDKPYIFTLQQLIEKIKKEHDVDLEDLTQKSIVHRREDTALQKPIYEVHLVSKKSPDYQTDYFLIDGITGEVLFETTYFNRDEKSPTPYYQYLRLLKNKEQEDNAFYKNYKGKDYTKKEWEAFEEEWFRDYEERKKGGNFFWDNIFKK